MANVKFGAGAIDKAGPVEEMNKKVVMMAKRFKLAICSQMFTKETCKPNGNDNRGKE